MSFLCFLLSYFHHHFLIKLQVKFAVGAVTSQKPLSHVNWDGTLTARVALQVACDNQSVEIIAKGIWADLIDDAWKKKDGPLCVVIFDVVQLKDPGTGVALGALERYDNLLCTSTTSYSCTSQ